MQVTKEQFIRDFKDTLHEEQQIKIVDATPRELFIALAKTLRKYYTPLWLERRRDLEKEQKRLLIISPLSFYRGAC